jgi:tripartite ATP-independent transporter DctM subunit
MIVATGQWLALAMFAAVFALLPLGFPVGMTVLGTALAFAFAGNLAGLFDWRLLQALPLRIFGLMDNDLLQAIPLFLYLGVVLERTRLARDLIDSLGQLFGRRPGGYAVATLAIGVLIAPTTGAVGATVLALGLLALPAMLHANYERSFACGLTAATGTLGTVLPPSIILILLADAMRAAKTEAQVAMGQMPSGSFVIMDLYLGMLLPVAIVVAGYALIVLARIALAPQSCPHGEAPRKPRVRLLVDVLAPLAIIAAALAAIVTGFVYTVEAAAAAAVAITLLALVRGELSLARMREISLTVMRLSGMMFLLMMGASTFSLVFRGFDGHLLVRDVMAVSFSSSTAAVAVVFACMILFGFFLDALEIILLVVPVVIPPLIVLGGDPLWLAVLLALTLQTSFLLPPSGFALFFLKSVAPPGMPMREVYRGVRPFLLVQALVLVAVFLLPRIAQWLPARWG